MEIEEACPDIEIIFNLRRAGIFVETFEVNINKRRLVMELKDWLSRKLKVDAAHLRIVFDSMELLDTRTLLSYEVETDDELILIDESP